MELIIQKISLEWSKKYRGAPFSSKRSGLALAYSLPETPSNKNNNAYLHSICILQTDQSFVFKNNPLQSLDLQNEIKNGCIHIALTQDGIEVFFEYNYAAGAPARYGQEGNLLKEKAFILQKDEFGQIIYNGRISLEDSWAYQKICFNILYTGNFCNDLFLKKLPAKKYEQLAILR